MKKRYLLIIYLILIVAAVLIFFFEPFSPIVRLLIIINIIIYLIRTPIIRIFRSIFKKRVIVRIVLSFGINITWGIFLMWLLLAFSPESFVALLSFLIVAVSLTFRETIKNITSGFFILATEQFEVGDLIMAMMLDKRR